MSNNPYAGRLDAWRVQQVSKKSYIIWGYINWDAQERFPDGVMIHTSSISSKKYPANKLKEGDIVETLNSEYSLGKSLEEVMKND